MKTIELSTRADGRSSKLALSLAVLGLMLAGGTASAATLLEEYIPFHVGDHYKALTAQGTNSVTVEAGVARYPGSFTLVNVSTVSGMESTNVSYVGYSGTSAVTYESDTEIGEAGVNTTWVFGPPEVIMTEAALESLGTRFTGTSSYTNSVVEGGQTYDTVITETISGVVNSTGTVTVVAGTFNDCLASVETTTTTETTMGYTSSSTNSQTLFYAANVGCIKVIEQSTTNVFELIEGVVGGVTVGGGGGTQKPTVEITSPANGASVTGNSVTVRGTASDSAGVVAGVYCRVDGGSWSLAQGTGNWLIQASLSAGANSIEAYAADAAGNLSTTDTVSVTCVEVNPFAALKGTYNGLFYGANAVAATNSGAFTMALTDKGSYTGTLWLGGSSLALLGSFNAQGVAQQTLTRPKQTSVSLNLQLDLTGGQQVTGTVQAAGWGAELLGYRVSFDAKTNPAPSGNYTMVVGSSANTAEAPAGYSFGTVAVAAGGQVTFKGTLADGTTAMPVVLSLSPNGLWPFCVSLYQGNGLMIGWVGLTNQTLASGDMAWVKAGGAGGKNYPDGFAFESEASGCKYVAPAAGHPLLNWSNGVVRLEGGGLTKSLTNTITVNAKNQVQVTGANTDKLTLTLTPATGLFSGSFQPPGATKPVVFNGVVLSGLEWAGGFFLGTNQTGTVSIGKQ
jgi:hypothetical protein